MRPRSTPPLLDAAHFVGRVDGHDTELHLLGNAHGMVVAVTNLGAKILQILVPDRDGHLDDVVLGYSSLEGVLNGSPSMGAFIGRYAGRIAQSQFKWYGTQCQLTPNAGPHCVHGGPRGSRHQVFEAKKPSRDTLWLHTRFASTADGFPGTLDLRLSYHLTETNALVIRHDAVAVEGDSPASFTSHAYFNLDGASGDSIDQHSLQIDAVQWLETDAQMVATGRRLPLEGSPLDLREARLLSQVPELDHAFEIRPAQESGALRHCARLMSEVSGRTLDVLSTEPVMQVYTAGALGKGEAPDIGKHGVTHRPRSAICLEPQQYPNAPNCPAFPLRRVTSGHAYQATTVYQFGTL